MTGAVVILGGAVIGSFAAWSLRRLGHTGPITVVERDPTYAYSSTARSAASIRAQFGTPVNVALSLYGIDFLRGVRAHLGPDADIGYREGGYLILGGHDQVAARRDGVRRQQAAGADVVALTPDDLRARFGFLNLADIGIGTFGQTGEGWFDAWALLQAVRRAARAAGVSYLADSATGFVCDHDRTCGVTLASGATLPCDWAVIACGPASGRMVAPLGIALPVSPRKRTVFAFRAPVSGAGFPMLFDTSGIWVRPEGAGFIGGIQPPADQDPDATDDFEPHHALLEDLYWPHLAHRIPAMAELRLDRAWAGHYEVNALDHNGVVGPHDRLRNLIFATGFSGHGVMHAPGVGRAVAEWITAGRYTTLDITALGWDRIRDARPLVEAVVY